MSIFDIIIKNKDRKKSAPPPGPFGERPKRVVYDKKHIDVSGDNPNFGVVNDPLFVDKPDQDRVIYVNYDTNEDGTTGFTDTLDPLV